MFETAGSIGYALPMRLIICTILALYLPLLNAETVYKTVDEDGNIIFTDKPSADSEEIKLKELQTIDNPNPAQYRPPSKKSKPIDESNVYKTLLITNPTDGSGIRNNAGNVTISVSLQPGLRSGHSIVIKMDGKEISNGSATSASLSNIDRGSHNIDVSVVNSAGKSLISSSSSFSLLRASQ